MHLSQLNINQLIVQKILEYLDSEHSYSTLRAHCLALKPIASVTHAIGQHLRQLLNTDKNLVQASLHQQVCEQQIREDRDEIAFDQCQAEHDRHQHQVLLCEQEEQQRSMAAASNAIGQIDVCINPILIKISDLDHQINACIQYQQQSQSHTHSHSHSNNVHSHSQPSNVHAHSQNEDRIHHHSDSTIPGVIVEDERLKHLRQEHSLLTNRLASYRAEQSSLNDTIRRARDRCDAITQSLRHLTQESSRRIEREAARNVRASARIVGGSDDLNQLSSANRTLLKQKIIKTYSELEQQCGALDAQAEQEVYAVYLAQLFQHKSTDHLSSNEFNALKKIVSTMRDYLRQQTNEQRLKNEMLMANSALSNFNVQLNDEMQNLQRLQQQIPELHEVNQQLRKDIDVRTTAREKRQKHNQGIVIAGSILLTASLILVAIPPLIPFGVFSSAVFTVLFTLAAVTGSVALGLFIAATVCAIKNYWDKHFIEHNEQRFNNNIRSMAQNDERITQLSQQELPELRANIHHQKAVCLQQNEQLQQLRQNMSLILDEAYQIVPEGPAAVVSSYNLFQPENQPSAPPLEPGQNCYQP